MDIHREEKNCRVIHSRGEWGQKLPPKTVIEENGQVKKQSKRGCSQGEVREAKKRRVEREINLQVEEQGCPPQEEIETVKFDGEG